MKCESCGEIGMNPECPSCSDVPYSDNSNFKQMFKDAGKSPQFIAEGHFIAVGEIIAELIEERDKYKEALEVIAEYGCTGEDARDMIKIAKDALN